MPVGDKYRVIKQKDDLGRELLKSYGIKVGDILEVKNISNANLDPKFFVEELWCKDEKTPIQVNSPLQKSTMVKISK